MKPIVQLSWNDVQILRRKSLNGKQVSVTAQEVSTMKNHLETLYSGTVTMSFSEKICRRNKEY